MIRIVRPIVSASVSAGISAAAITVEVVAIEEVVVHDNPPAEPVGSPSPAAPSQTAEIASNRNSVAVGEPEFGVVERRVVTIRGRSPNILRIVRRHVHYLG